MDNGPSEKQRQAIKAREAKAEKRKAAKVKTVKPAVPKPKRKPRTKTFEYPVYKPGMGREFYKTRAWMSIRWDVLQASDRCCVVCGRSAKDKVTLHVDHIKPRSRYPELELDRNNLQVLCECCNIGKGSK